MASKVSGLIEQIQPGGSNGTKYAIASTAYGVCESAASDNPKIVEITGFKLIEGVTIHVRFNANNSASNPKLQIKYGTGTSDKTAEIPIVQYGTTAAGATSETNGWNSGAVLTLTYDGTSWVRDQGFNTNSNDTSVMYIRVGNARYYPTTNYQRYVLGLIKNQTQIIPLNTDKNNSNNNGTTGATHILTTEAFDITSNIFVFNNNDASYTSSDLISAGALWYAHAGVDLRYSFNLTNTYLTAHKDVYVKAILQSPTTAILYTTNDTNPITQDLPTTEETNVIYILLGRAYSGYQISLFYEHPIFWYKGGQVRRYGFDANTINGYSIQEYDTYLYNNIKTFTNETTPTTDFWFVKITMTWNSNGRYHGNSAIKVKLNADYSNTRGTTYLLLNEHNVNNWSAYTTTYNGCNIKAIKRVSDNNNYKQILYIKLDKPTAYNNTTPKGTITAYAACPIDSIESTNDPSNMIDLNIPGFTIIGDTIKSNGTITANTFSGSGASLTNLNASNISSGTLSLSYLTKGSANTALMGKGTNTASAYVSVTPSISITAGTTDNAPKINLTVLGVTGQTAQELTKASTSVYGATKLYNGVDSTSTSLAATANAVKTAYDQATTALNTANNVIDAADALVFKGTIGAGGTVETLPDTHSIGWTYKAIEDATFAGKVCEIGDLIICVADGTTENNDDWTIVQENINGYIHFYNNHNNNIDSLISTPYLQTAAKQGGNWTGTKPTGSHNGVALFNFQTHSGNYYTQLALDTSGNRLWLRSANNATTFGAWAKIATIADIEALDGNLNNTAPGAGKTLTAFLQTDGKVSATFDDISITKSQVSDFSHTHGNITNDGKIGSTADYAVYTTTGGAITAGSLATDAPTASGTALSFITSVSQNSKGKISANKATVATFIKSGSTAAAGLVPKPDTTAGTGKFLCEDGTWKTPSYTTNTDKKLDQTLDSSSTDTFPLLFSDNNTTVTTATINSSAKRNNNIYIKPSTGQLNSTEFVVNAHARLTYNSTIKSLDFILI